MRVPTASLSVVTFLMSQVGRIVEVQDEMPGSYLVIGEADRLSAAATLLCGLGPRGEVVEPSELRAAIPRPGLRRPSLATPPDLPCGHHRART